MRSAAIDSPYAISYLERVGHAQARTGSAGRSRGGTCRGSPVDESDERNRFTRLEEALTLCLMLGSEPE